MHEILAGAHFCECIEFYASEEIPAIEKLRGVSHKPRGLALEQKRHPLLQEDDEVEIQLVTDVGKLRS